MKESLPTEESQTARVQIKANQDHHGNIYLEAFNWTDHANLKARYGHTAVVFNNRIWMIGGMVEGHPTNDILYSVNGVQWETVPLDLSKKKNRFSPRTDHASTVFDGKIWVVGGKEPSKTDHDEIYFYGNIDGAEEHDHGLCDRFSELNDVWSSVDGIHWNLESEDTAFLPRYHHSLTTHQNELYLFGGYNRDSHDEIIASAFKGAWKSANGIDWEPLPEFKNIQHVYDARVNGSSISFKNYLIYLGYNAWEAEGDIYYSLNGFEWNKSEVDVEVASRSGHVLVSDGAGIWLTAGAFTNIPVYASQNDVWYSQDGENWIEVELSQGFPARKDHTSVFFKNRLWIINGYNMEKGNALPDVWSFGELGCCEVEDLQLLED